jgi:predicted transcriptional regulator
MDKILLLLQKCGYRRTIAAVLTYLIEFQNRQSTSKDIEEVMGLRQPEVTLAMSALLERKWVISEVAERPAEKRGPPTYTYKLADADLVYSGISREQQKNVIDIQKTLKELYAAMIPQKKDESQEVQKKELVLK